MSSRVPELDSLRGLAAVGIVLWHYSGHFQAQPISMLLFPFYNAGDYLVDFFFVLSGFVLAMAYSRSKRQRRVANSIMDRIARLYPLHLITLLLVMLGQAYLARIGKGPFIYQYNDSYHFALNLLMAHSLGLQKGFSFNGPAWAISALFVVNVLFFLVALKAKRPGTVFIVLMLLSLLGFVCHKQFIVSGKLLGILDGSLLRAGFGFFTGVVFYDKTKELDPSSRTFRLVVDGIYTISLAMTVWFFCGPLNDIVGIDVLTVLVMFPALVYGASKGYVVSWALKKHPLIYLGKISYSIYLVHFPLQLLIHVAQVSGWASFEFERPMTLMGFMAVVLALSILAHHLIELPGKKLLQEMMYNRFAKPSG
jgi:peptidoglycan/LPS O-acetylase OafA/YrhL